MTWLSYVVRNLRRWLAAYGQRHPVTEASLCVSPLPGLIGLETPFPRAHAWS